MISARAPTRSALLLAGLAWVLAQPPLLSNGTVGTSLPVGKWTVAGRFATRAACERQRANDSGVMLGALAKGADDPGSRAAMQIATAMRCIELPPTSTPR